MSPADILDQVKTNKAKSTNDVILERTKGTVAGTIIGGGIGLSYAFFRKKNYLVCAIVGVLIGGMVTHFMISREVNKTTA